MSETLNTWGIFFSLCCVILPFILCFYIGKLEKEESKIVRNNSCTSIFEWDDYGEKVKKTA